MNLNKVNFLVVCFLISFLANAQAESNQPNIILIFTDDHGYSDLSIQGVLDDIKTPHTDKLAQSGVHFTSGYCTAPQCRPSRAGLLTGRYQNRFGLEQNGDAALPWSENTIAERLTKAGYITGMCGKWHLDGSVGSNGERPDGTMGKRVTDKGGQYSGDRMKNPGYPDNHGFQEYLNGSMIRYVATHDAKGKDLGGKTLHEDRRFRVDVQAEWASNFIKRNSKKDKPFFLYVPFFAPHVPLEATEKYLARFPGEMPRRRRIALAMISAIDDGVGLITKTLAEEEQTDNTLIFYISDNGAPLKIHKEDLPGNGPGWDGSLNDPWIGEKGMLTEGGIRVPFIASWPNKIPANQVYNRPVISIDATATALVAAGLKLDEKIDGVDLIPVLTGKQKKDPHDALYWRWVGQAAVREGDWKYLKGDEFEYLFNVNSDEHEKKNLIKEFPDRAAKLKDKLQAWSQELLDPGLDHPIGRAGTMYFNHYLNGIEPPPRKKPAKPVRLESPENEQDWVYLDNGLIRLGVDKSRGACIGFFGESKTKRNLLNHFDTGRFIQQSYYGDPDGSHWNGKPWVYNPVQGGNWQRKPSKLLEFKLDENNDSQFSKVQPLRWSSGLECPEVVMEQKISLEDDVANIHFKMTYSGEDQMKKKHQEMPAMFVDAELKNLVFANRGKVHRRVPAPKNEMGEATQNWFAYVDDKDFGIGIYTPGTKDFTSYHVKGDGKTGPTGSACSYVAPIRTFNLTKGLTVEYDAYLTVGSIEEIRKRFARLRRANAEKK